MKFLKKFSMPFLLSIAFIFYTFLSWVILFRDAWTLEVLETKFYPALAPTIESIRYFLSGVRLNTIPTFLFLFFALCSFGLYFLSWKKNIAAKKIIIWSVVFQLIVFFSWPILSTDILSYILSDRIAVTYHQNVWATKPNQFSSDPYYYLVYPIYAASDWTNQTRIYGPVNQAVYSLATFFSGNDLLVNLAVHKLVVLLFVLASLALVYKISKGYFPDKLAFVLIFLFWNPLFILETSGSGHNDIIMIFFILLSYFFYRKSWPLAVGLSLALAVNIKSTALFLAPIYSIIFLRDHFSDSIKFGGTFLAFSVLLFLTMGISPQAMLSRTAFSTNLFWQSLPQQLSKIAPQAVFLLTPIFLVVFGLILLRSFIKKSDPLVVYGQTYFLYLLLALGAYWNWYSLWVLSALMFLGRSRLTLAAAAFTFSSLLAYPLYWLSLRFNYQHPLWPVIIYLVIAVFPLSVFLSAKISKQIPF